MQQSEGAHVTENHSSNSLGDSHSTMHQSLQYHPAHHQHNTVKKTAQKSAAELYQ